MGERGGRDKREVCDGSSDVCYFDFFFQAEDGIRDYDVTGVQTCALPIYGFGGKACVLAALDKSEDIPVADVRDQ